jgi:hypothetical protein
MMHIYFHTNLDEAQPDVRGMNAPGNDYHWPPEFGIPAVDSEVVFEFWRDNRRLGYHLRVCAVRYVLERKTVNVELHMPTAPHQSIAEWTTWFRRHRLGREW